MTDVERRTQEIYECQTCGTTVLDTHGNCSRCGSSQVVSSHVIDRACENVPILQPPNDYDICPNCNNVECVCFLDDPRLTEDDVLEHYRPTERTPPCDTGHSRTLAPPQNTEPLFKLKLDPPLEPTITLTRQQLAQILNVFLDTYYEDWAVTIDKAFDEQLAMQAEKCCRHGTMFRVLGCAECNEEIDRNRFRSGGR